MKEEHQANILIGLGFEITLLKIEKFCMVNQIFEGERTKWDFFVLPCGLKTDIR